MGRFLCFLDYSPLLLSGGPRVPACVLWGLPPSPGSCRGVDAFLRVTRLDAPVRKSSLRVVVVAAAHFPPIVADYILRAGDADSK